MKLERVVLGIDFSKPSLQAADWCAHHFAPRAELVLVHALDVPEPPRFLAGRYPPRATLLETARCGAMTRLEALARTLAAQKVTVEVGVGRPVDRLLESAAARGADLIAVGRHGEEHGVWGWLGSTADALVRSSTVPVLLAAGAMDAPPRRILAATDDDALTSTVLQWARFLARRSDAHITALHVVSNAALSHVLSLEAAATGQNSFTKEEIAARFHEEATGWLQRLVDAGVRELRAGSEIAFGAPAEEITAAAERAHSDLIIVGRKAARPLRRLVLGSVVSKVIRLARCPVFVAVEAEDMIVDDTQDNRA